MRKILILFCVLFVLLTSCETKKVSDLELFAEKLSNSSSFEISMSAKRDYPIYPIDLDINFKKNNDTYYSKYYLNMNKEVLFDGENYLAFLDNSIDIYQKKDGNFQKESYPIINSGLVDISFNFTFYYDCFVYDTEYEQYRLNDEEINKLNLSLSKYSLKINRVLVDLVNDKELYLKADFAYQTIILPVNIRVFNLGSTNIVLPTN